MTIATLLTRESSSISLNIIVERSQLKKAPFPEYDLRLHSCQLELVLVSRPSVANLKSTSSDEGFESDIDSLSIVSSDDSFTNNQLENPVPKTETDSANGSACSDSDEVDSSAPKNSDSPPKSVHTNESFHLVNCVCYSDVKCPNLLVFVVKDEVLVFKFNDLDVLNKFYVNFNALKAVTNQKTYARTINNNNTNGTKFNLLQRTDNNGVTHIEISREPNCNLILPDNYEPTSILSINAPDFKNSTKSKPATLLIDNQDSNENDLRKVWKSTEDLSGKKPERRRKIKGKAPEPPIEQKDVLKGEYVRVNVPKVDPEEKIPPLHDQKLNRAFPILGNVKPKLTTYQQFKYSEPKKFVEDGTLTRSKVNLENWTNSVPRLLKSQRSRSETRNFTPMAYRYIDTTVNNSPMYHRRYQPMLLTALPTVNNQISNRLFGMSGKLREFNGTIQARCEPIALGKAESTRWGSLNELSQKLNSEHNLKSVIKKEENIKRKNDKKLIVMWPPSKFLRVKLLNAKSTRTLICHSEEKKQVAAKSIRRKVIRVVMVRHGESEWNEKNLFTGWYDADLSPKGIREAEEAGTTLKRLHYCFDNAFTSVLSRAIDTLSIIQGIINHKGIPVYRTWRLNERHYGALTGLNKAQTAKEFGEDKVKIWRRSYDVPPPPMKKDHPYYRAIVHDSRYHNDPPRDQFPMYESLKLTLERTLPYWEGTILPKIGKGRRVLIVAHGNSLRGIVKKLENLSDEEIMGVNLPTGIPFQYVLDAQTLKPVYPTRRFLGDADVVRKATEAVAKQGKAKE
ncbi:hypothetical protein Trydic_g23253 [Trypoxylus dichotomus]